MKIKTMTLCMAAAMLPASHGWASGISVDSQNAVGMGNANAGSAALAEDASTVYFNPAGMSRLGSGQKFSGTVTFTEVDTSFDDKGSTAYNASTPLGELESDIKRTAVVPAFFYAAALSDKIHAGLGLSPTFGNRGEWDKNFIGRYQGSETQIQGLNLNPSLSIALNPDFSVGFGINYLKLDAELIRRSPLSPTEDGYLTLEGDDGSWGYNVGMLWQMTPDTRAGLSYRSTIKMNVKGSVDADLGALRLSIPAGLDIEFPDTASLGLVHRINEQWDLLADMSWYGWSTIPTITVVRQADGSILQEDELYFKNGTRTGIGATYRHSPEWTLRTGVAVDRGVAREPHYLSVRFPDNDRTWVAFGANYALNKNSSIDIGYSHAFVKEANIDRVTLGSEQVVRGTFDSTADLLAVQWNRSF